MGVSIHKPKPYSRFLLPELLHRSPETGIYLDKQHFMKMLNSTDERNAIRNRDINHSMEKNLKYRGSNIVIEDPKVIFRDKETPFK